MSGEELNLNVDHIICVPTRCTYVFYLLQFGGTQEISVTFLFLCTSYIVFSNRYVISGMKMGEECEINVGRFKFIGVTCWNWQVVELTLICHYLVWISSYFFHFNFLKFSSFTIISRSSFLLLHNYPVFIYQSTPLSIPFSFLTFHNMPSY